MDGRRSVSDGHYPAFRTTKSNIFPETRTQTTGRRINQRFDCSSFPRSAWERNSATLPRRKNVESRLLDLEQDAERPQGAFPRGAWERGVARAWKPMLRKFATRALL